MGGWVHRLSEIDGDRAVCANCGPVPLYMKRNGDGVRQPRCSIAIKNQKRGAQPEPPEPMYRSRGHRLSSKEANEYRRGKSCGVCGRSERLHIDHDHATGQIRGVLCHFCNLGLGHFFDDPELLRGAADYLTGFSTPANSLVAER